MYLNKGVLSNYAVGFNQGLQPAERKPYSLTSIKTFDREGFRKRLHRASFVKQTTFTLLQMIIVEK